MTKSKRKKLAIDRWVVVTTDAARRGVFYGKLKSWNKKEDYLVLEEAKMIVKWSEETRSVLGLASKGPAKGSRVSDAVPRIELNGITAVMDTTKEAQERFKQDIWD